MTKQETYNLIVAHLRKQGAKCMVNDVTCGYINSARLKSAIGALIPEGKYDQWWEGQYLYELPDLQAIMIEEGHDLQLLSALEAVHDGSNPENWEGGFEYVAWQHDLSYLDAFDDTMQRLARVLNRPVISHNGDKITTFTPQSK